MADRYEFLRTTEVDGKVVALIADTAVLGTAGVTSLRQAFAAHAAPKIRSGVMTLTAEQLRERLPVLEEQGMTRSAQAYTKALESIDARNKKKRAEVDLQAGMGSAR